MALLEGLRWPGESSRDTLRRVLREAAARRPVDEALRALEARLARIETRAPGAAAQASPTQEPETDRQRVAETVRRLGARWSEQA